MDEDEETSDFDGTWVTVRREVKNIDEALTVIVQAIAEFKLTETPNVGINTMGDHYVVTVADKVAATPQPSIL